VGDDVLTLVFDANSQSLDVAMRMRDQRIA